MEFIQRNARRGTEWAVSEASGGFDCFNPNEQINSESEAERSRQVKMDVKLILGKKSCEWELTTTEEKRLLTLVEKCATSVKTTAAACAHFSLLRRFAVLLHPV